MTKDTSHNEQAPQKESLLLNLILNIAIPTFILMKLSGETALGAERALIIALAFPVLYGLYDFTRAKKINYFSLIAIVSILLTGGISLLKLDPKYIAIKEAAIPGLLGLASVISVYTRYPVLRLLYNEKLVQVERIAEAISEHRSQQAFDNSFRTASFILASSFFLSSALNYALARYLLVSPPGTEAYNAELGRMTALSFPVIAVPSTIVMFIALLYLIHRITKLTHLKLEDIFAEHHIQQKTE